MQCGNTSCFRSHFIKNIQEDQRTDWTISITVTFFKWSFIGIYYTLSQLPQIRTFGDNGPYYYRPNNLHVIRVWKCYHQPQKPTTNHIFSSNVNWILREVSLHIANKLSPNKSDIYIYAMTQNRDTKLITVTLSKVCMLPYYLVKIRDTSNCHIHKMSETIWHERFKLSCKIQSLKNCHWKSRCLEHYLTNQKIFSGLHLHKQQGDRLYASVSSTSQETAHQCAVTHYCL